MAKKKKGMGAASMFGGLAGGAAKDLFGRGAAIDAAVRRGSGMAQKTGMKKKGAKRGY